MNGKKVKKPGILQVISPLLVTVRQFKNSLIKPATVLYPYEKLEDKSSFKNGVYFGIKKDMWENHRGFIILDIPRCISCGSCERACPNKCLRLVPTEHEHAINSRLKKMPAINFARCLFCKLCVESCPTEALYMTPYYAMAEETREKCIFSPEELYEMKKIYPRPKSPKLAYTKPYAGKLIKLEDYEKSKKEESKVKSEEKKTEVKVSA